ncbi:MAG: B12-binding domain-containing radical SAM protein [Elusimicrobia bacterium RIFCSPLOWO2_12_FULL_59_9]|nr:MAG: B12-binding domain-containing radical SAM protein [Elusimicrobia bacterium RIFCSPLOWO2_12_FULL_59_9]
MSDILLSHAYFIAEDPREQGIMKPYPPLGLLYVSSHLKAKGFAVDLFDGTFKSMPDYENHLWTTRPPVTGLYCTLMSKPHVLKMIQLCKAAGSRVILGGPEPPPYALEYLRSGADVVVHGEGELALQELIPHLKRFGAAGLNSIDGISFLDEDGRLVQTPPRAQIINLSQQPWPDREAIDMDRYLDVWKTHHGSSSVSLITSRGCPYTCAWCSHSVFGETHRRRQPWEVAEEVAWLQNKYAPDRLWYADDVFTIHRGWLLEFAGELKKRGLKIPFECISRADRLDDALIAALREMGCFRLWIGAESGSQKILDAMRRRTTIEDVRLKTRSLQNNGIQVGMFVMLGYEGEQCSDIEATVDHLKKSAPDVFLSTVAYPIKGTRYYEAVSSKILSNLSWSARTDRDLKISGRRSKRFYAHATRWMDNEVNFHKLLTRNSLNLPRMLKLLANAKRGRLGMWWTRNETEEDPSQGAGGRGWPSRERAEAAW